MTHDPLCHDPDSGIAPSTCGWCRVIARTRADERSRTTLSPIGSTTGSGQVTGIIGKAFYDAGRLDALDAAREAVERVSTLFEPLGPALDAIDALREEQK